MKDLSNRVHIGCKTIRNNNQKMREELSTMSTKVSTMKAPKINDSKLIRLIDIDLLSQSEVARKLGVSRQAISKRLQELRGKTTRAIVVKKVEQVVDQKIDAISQLHSINQKANELLAVAETEDDRHTILRCMAEIRAQLDLQLKIFATLYDLQAAEEFQNTVIEAIGEASTDVRDRIIQRINAKRAVRSAVKFT